MLMTNDQRKSPRRE